MEWGMPSEGEFTGAAAALSVLSAICENQIYRMYRAKSKPATSQHTFFKPAVPIRKQETS
jgi:hypothetical protein